MSETGLFHAVLAAPQPIFRPPRRPVAQTRGIARPDVKKRLPRVLTRKAPAQDAPRRFGQLFQTS
jgi:hypothetical protein